MQRISMMEALEALTDTVMAGRPQGPFKKLNKGDGPLVIVIPATVAADLTAADDEEDEEDEGDEGLLLGALSTSIVRSTLLSLGLADETTIDGVHDRFVQRYVATTMIDSLREMSPTYTVTEQTLPDGTIELSITADTPVGAK